MRPLLYTLAALAALIALAVAVRESPQWDADPPTPESNASHVVRGDEQTTSLTQENPRHSTPGLIAPGASRGKARTGVAAADGDARQETVRGRILYSSTGQGLPWASVSVDQSAEGDYDVGELVLTDREGWFSLAGLYANGPLRLTIANIPDESSPILRTVDHRVGELIQVAVETWPTFLFEFDPEIPVTQGEVWVTTDVMEYAEGPFPPESTSWWRSAFLGTEFCGPQLALARSQTHPVILTLTSKADGWSVNVSTASVDGVVTLDVLSSSLQTGALTVHISAADGRALPDYYRIHHQLDDLQPLSPDYLDGRIEETESGSRLSYTGLAPSQYLLTLGLEGGPVHQETVVVGPGSSTELYRELSAPASAGTIEGTVRTRSGAPPGTVQIHLTCWNGEDMPVLRTCFLGEEETESPWVGQFSFEDLPDLPYEVTISSHEHLLWDDHLLADVRVGDYVSFVADDTLPLAEYEICAIGASTGEPIASIRAWIYIDGTHGTTLRPFGGCETVSLPQSSPLHCHLTAEGYIAQWIDQTAFQLVGPGFLRARVRLEPGWQRDFRIYGPDWSELEGVEVIVDGVVAGTTDGDGVAVVRLGSRPQKVEFRYGDWIPSSDYAEAFASFLANDHEPDVELALVPPP